MMKKGSGILRIGTSNVVIPVNKQSFPAQFRDKSRLHYYASLFNTVEINSSFYKVPMPATFKKWAIDVPAGFRFSIKLTKEVSHIKELNIDVNHIDSFLEAAEGTGNKKGCLLIQFPGKITLAYYKQVEGILKRLNKSDSKNNWKKVIEFRSADWYCSEVYELLDEHKASLVMHDIPKGKNRILNKAAQVAYVRYHGPAGDYRGSYTNDFLLTQLKLIQQWLAEKKDVYAYFNNTIGNAFENALTLKKFARDINIGDIKNKKEH